MRKTLVALTGALLLVVTACAQGTPPTAAPPAAPSPSGQSADAAPTATTAQPTSAAPTSPAPTAAPTKTAQPKAKSCDSKKGASGKIDLRKVTIAKQGAYYKTTWTMQSKPPGDGLKTFQLVIRSAEKLAGYVIYARGFDVGFSRGMPMTAMDLTTQKTDSLNSGSLFRASGKTVTMSFPESYVKKLGANWTWQASVYIDSNYASDVCPASGFLTYG